MKNNFIGFNLDFLGFAASVICAIHCSVLPLILAIGALGGLAWLENPAIEWSFIIFSIIIASWSLTQSYFQNHRKLGAIHLALLGFALLIASRLVEGLGEPILTTFGGILIALAHFYNWRLLQNCANCKVKPIPVKSS